MSVPFPPLPQDPGDVYADVATGRRHSLFAADVERARGLLRDQIRGRRLLVIGGGGSIGSATAIRLAGYEPQCLHVIDQNENTLVELVRTVRGAAAPAVEDFRTWALDLGSREMRGLLRSQPAYDAVLNLAAAKHVRSEKDVFAAMHMLDTNVLKPCRLLQWLDASAPVGRYFAVSTDKAANPSSVLGASKRLMERTMLERGCLDLAIPHITTARFPNVAFSQGSLLDGFLYRLGKRQPLACPTGVRRFFISLTEAAEICLLAAFGCPDGRIAIPHHSLDLSSVPVEDVAIRLLARFGLEPAYYDDNRAAVAAVETELARRRYPVVLTPLDTSGEKPDEEFVAAREHVADSGWPSLSVVTAPDGDVAALRRCLTRLERLRRQATAIDKADLIAIVAGAIPEFDHHETGQNLDMRL